MNDQITEIDTAALDTILGGADVCKGRSGSIPLVVSGGNIVPAVWGGGPGWADRLAGQGYVLAGFKNCP
jgi:hypothetical protein